MKLAILGSSPLALEAALRFHFHGASLTLFSGKEEPIEWSGENISHLGTRTLIETGLTTKKIHNREDWKNWYQKPLMNFLRQHQVVKEHEVVSVTKRFLARDEEIPGKSRFYDLFRVIYEMNPQEFISEQKETNPELYHKLSEEFMGSLQSTLEMYEDFDLVLDLRYPMITRSMAVNGRALGEKRINPAKVIYGLETLKKHPEENDRDIAVIGSGKLAAEVILRLEKWLQDPRMNLFVITTDADPFADNKKVSYILEAMEKDFQSDIVKFQTQLRDWQELDDFVQVKYPRPAEPIPRLNFFSGHNVSAVDELIDRKRLFLTLECPDFRQGKKHPLNNQLELKTLGVDKIFVALDPVKKNVSENLRILDPGYFDVTPDCWEKDLERLKGIEDEIFKLFSPTDTL